VKRRGRNGKAKRRSEPSRGPKVVFDCNVYLQALIKETGPAAACLTLFENGTIELCVSEALLTELRDVLTRPKLQLRYSSLTEERADRLIASLRQRAKLLKSVPHVFRYSRDPKDEPYLNLAIAAGAAYLISRDDDLLDLMTGVTPDCKEFRQRFRRIRIVDPVAFLKEFEAAQA
jgi:uncharacterized protein